MDQLIKRKQSFLLRLPTNLREHAVHLAQCDGTSLNHFISIAVAEKVIRMENELTHPPVAPSRTHQRPGVFHRHGMDDTRHQLNHLPEFSAPR